MSTPTPVAPLSPDDLRAIGRDCWNQIGTSGDESCPELKTQIHCRNCPVFAAAARTFFDRPAPDDYLAEWTRWLGGSVESTGQTDRELPGADRDQVSVLIFRLGQEWLAFHTETIAEVTVPRPVHRIPHRSNEILTGLVNLRGQLQLCVSLHGLIGIGPSGEHAASEHGGPQGAASDRKPRDETSTTATNGRLVVLRDRERSETWIFPTEEVLGVHRLPRAQLQGISSSLSNPEVNFSQSILDWQGRKVGLLDEQRVFASLRGIGQ